MGDYNKLDHPRFLTAFRLLPPAIVAATRFPLNDRARPFPLITPVPESVSPSVSSLSPSLDDNGVRSRRIYA